MAHAVVSDLEGIGVCISGVGNPVPLCVQLVKLTIPVKTIPHVSVSHPFIERLIGTIRREYLDHVLFWNESDLERKLDVFKEYYNGSGIHQSLNQQTPEEVQVKPHRHWQTQDISCGSPIVRDCFRHQWQPDEEFARQRVNLQ